MSKFKGGRYKLRQLFSIKPQSSYNGAGNGGIWARLGRLVRFNFLKILRLKTSAHSIALGAAFGIFVGFLPIIPFQSIVVLTLAFIFRANKIAAFSCTFISNVLNLIPFYTMLYMVGIWVLPFERVHFDPHHLKLMELVDQGWRLVAVMSVGGVVLGVPSAIIMYFVTRNLVLGYRRRRAMKLLQKRDNA